MIFSRTWAAFGVDAAPLRLERRVVARPGWLDFDRAVADWAGAGRFDALRALWSFIEDDAEDVGDDLAGLLDLDGVADAEVRAGVRGFVHGEVSAHVPNAAVVVQGGVLHDGAGDERRLHDGAGRDSAALADLRLDPEQRGEPSFRRVLVCDDPAGAFRGRAEAVLHGPVVHADDHAVGGVGHLVAVGGESLDGADHVVDLAAAGLDRVHARRGS